MIRPAPAFATIAALRRKLDEFESHLLARLRPSRHRPGASIWSTVRHFP